MSNLEEFYSTKTLSSAEGALLAGRVIHTPGQRWAKCQSLTNISKVWTPSATVQDGEVIGVSCNCPNGSLGGIRARCWHAAVLEMCILEDQEGETSD